MTSKAHHGPRCQFCGQDGVDSPATYIAAQSVTQGETFDWCLVCDSHADGWNDGGDWHAPAFRIGEKVTL